jgi:hypothetical protein
MPSTPNHDKELAARYARRAPGWLIRCKRCGFTDPLGKYGIRLAAWSWKKCTLARCPRCHRFCCHAIVRRVD